MCVEKVLQSLLSEVRKDLCGRVKKGFRKALRGPIDLNVQKMLGGITILCLFTAVVMFTWGIFLYNGTIYTRIVNVSLPNQNCILYDINIVITVAVIAVLLFVLFFVEYVILLIEKNNNREKFSTQVNAEVRRKLKYISSFPSELLAITSSAELGMKEEWIIPSENGAGYIINKIEKMKNVWMNQYEKVCELLFNLINDNIQSGCQEKVHINVSIKAFVNKGLDEEKKSVFTMGRYTSERRGTNKHPSWNTLIKDSHYVSDDYAFSYIVEKNAVFICSDIEAFRAKREGLDDVQPYKTYSKRTFLATMVCPIAVMVNDNEYEVVGAICLDIDQKYPDWKNHGSYEENIVCFVAQEIAPLVVHNMQEAENARSLYESYYLIGGQGNNEKRIGIC